MGVVFDKNKPWSRAPGFRDEPPWLTEAISSFQEVSLRLRVYLGTRPPGPTEELGTPLCAVCPTPRLAAEGPAGRMHACLPRLWAAVPVHNVVL